MYAGLKLARALAALDPASHAVEVARRVGLAGLLTPVRGGAPVADLRFLYASRRRNRFTTSGGPRSLYMGEDEDIGSAETKRVALLGSFAKRRAEPAAVFWARVDFPAAVLDLTDAAVLAALGTTDGRSTIPTGGNGRRPRRRKRSARRRFATGGSRQSNTGAGGRGRPGAAGSVSASFGPGCGRPAGWNSHRPNWGCARFGRRGRHRLVGGGTRTPVPQSTWVTEVLSQVGYGQVLLFEFPAHPVGALAGLGEAFATVKRA